jgi:hypothetical protein
MTKWKGRERKAPLDFKMYYPNIYLDHENVSGYNRYLGRVSITGSPEYETRVLAIIQWRSVTCQKMWQRPIL